MEKNKPVFDANREISLTLESTEGNKTVAVRFPTDAEWTERQRKIKIITKQLGRGMSQTMPVDTRDPDADLVSRIRIGESPEVNEYEAVEIIEILKRADLDDVTREGNAFRVTLTVLGGVKTTHVVERPSAEDLFTFRRSRASALDIGNNRQKITVNLSAGGDLYKKRVKSFEGYASAAPIVHQAEVIAAIMGEIESRAGVAEENF